VKVLVDVGGCVASLNPAQRHVCGMDVEREVLKWALKNAFDHGGLADVKAVMSKVMGAHPELRSKAAEVKKMVVEKVEQVNSMSVEEQASLLAEIAPELTRKHEVREARRELPELPQAEEGRVVTRLPPEPSGYMHLGHAMAGLINEYYARRYGGKLWLRFEDTNPRKVRPIYYESFRQGYRWLGIEWDFEKNNSDDMELFYHHAKTLLGKGLLYPCFCTAEEMHRQRQTMTACRDRETEPGRALELWDKAVSGGFREGEISFRLRGYVDSPNTALRDPVLFRIVDYPHPLKGRDYSLWPTYDFAAAVEDAVCGVTHVLRSSEFAFRDELQNLIRQHLGLKNPVYVEFARFEFKGTPTSKRVIRELIEKGFVGGWDDPRLSTIDAVRRRGIRPEAIREFTTTYAGVSYAKKEYDWSLLYSINRKFLDASSRRLFFVPEPVKLHLENLDAAVVEAPFHPTQNLGTRKIEVSKTVYVPGRDIKALKPGEIFRCKYLANIRISSVEDDVVYGEVVGREPSPGVRIVQWVPEEAVRVRVFRYGSLLRSDGSFNVEGVEVIDGLGEKSVKEVGYREVVQFERFGFCIRDSGENLEFIYCHD
jgi:glutamyl-tRNA synthetase